MTQTVDTEPGFVALGAWLREVRTRRGLSQEAVAHAADLAVSTYSRLERGGAFNQRCNPTLSTLKRACAALGVTRGELDALNEVPWSVMITIDRAGSSTATL